MALTSNRDEDSIVGRASKRLGGVSTFKRTLTTHLDAHEAIGQGFPASVLVRLAENVALLRRPGALDKAIGVSTRTLQRRKNEASPRPLNLEQSGKAWKFATVLEQAIDVFGSQEEAEAFLDRPAMGLQQLRPIDLLSTSVGTELVETHLHRMKYSVYA